MANNDKLKENKKGEVEEMDSETSTKTLTADEQAILTKKELDEQAIDPEPVADV